MVGITVVCYKRKRNKQCTEQEDGNYSIAGEKSLQRPPTSMPEPEGQTIGILISKVHKETNK